MTRAAAAQRRAQLAVLSIANFAIGIGAFIVIGMLIPVAADFQIDVASAGWLLSIYAIFYAVSSPLLVAGAGRTEPRTVIAVGLGLFAAGAALAGAAPSYALMLVGRAVMAVGGGLVTPLAASFTVAVTPVAERGRALAAVFGGFTLAQVLGVPAGAWLAYAAGWRWGFGLVVALSATALVLLLALVPKGIAVTPTRVASLGYVLRTPSLALAILFTTLLIGASYVVYTYLAPLLEARYGFGRDGISAMLLVYGAGAVLGNAIGGRLSDRIGPRTTLIAIALMQALILPLIVGLPLPLWATIALLACWSSGGWGFMVPQQARLVTAAPPLAPVLLALNAAAIYVGASLGSILGGLVLRVSGLSMLGVAGAVLSLLAVATLLRQR